VQIFAKRRVALNRCTRSALRPRHVSRMALWPFDTKWAVVTVVITLVIETPRSLRYMRRNAVRRD
jgi:hypothetical protein